jgi:MerE protein
MAVTTAIRLWSRRKLSRRNRAGAWLAILTCPCHGAVVLYLAAGTAFGSVLLAYRTWMFAALAAAFVAGLWLMVKPDANVCTLEGQAREDTGAAPGDRRASSTSARTGGDAFSL